MEEQVESQTSARSGNSSEQRSTIAAAALARIEEQKKRQASNSVAKELESEKYKYEQKIRRLINEVAGPISYEKASGCLQVSKILIGQD